MLCPEVWNLKVTRNSVSIKSGVYESNNKQHVENMIRNHHFNQMITLILPNCAGSIPDDIVQLFNESDYYRVENLDLKELLEREFIEGFVKKGTLTALSWDTRNDIEDCFAVTPDGKLVLSIDKELYQTLGIEGQKSTGNCFKNIIKIDLKHPDLRNGKPFFERIKRALENEAFCNVSLQFTWDPPDSTICPSSLAKYFNDKNYSVKICHTKLKVHNERLLRCPKYTPGIDKDSDEPHELIEYLGMRMLSCEMGQDEILSSYCESVDGDEIKEAKVIHCKGFFTATFIRRLVDTLSANLREPGTTLCVNGFQYSPLTFFNREHTISTNGDNDYLLVLYVDKKFLLYQNASSIKKQ